MVRQSEHTPSAIIQRWHNSHLIHHSALPSKVSDHGAPRSGSLVLYADDDELHTMWAWTPLSHPKHCVSFFFTEYAPDYLHGRCQRRGHACGTIMSVVWSFVCGPPPTLSPSSQVPHALDAARVGCSHPHRHPGSVSIGSTNPSSHQPPVYTTQLLRDPAGVLSLGGGLF